MAVVTAIIIKWQSPQLKISLLRAFRRLENRSRPKPRAKLNAWRNQNKAKIKSEEHKLGKEKSRPRKKRAKLKQTKNSRKHQVKCPRLQTTCLMIVRQGWQQGFNPKTRNVGFVTESPKTAVSWEWNKLRKTQRRPLKRCSLSKRELQTEERSLRRERSFKFCTHNVTSAMRVGRNRLVTGTTSTKQWLSWKNTQLS